MGKGQRGEVVPVTAAILARHHQVLIAKRKATGSLPNKWEFPGGKVERGETPEECLRRELKPLMSKFIVGGATLGFSAVDGK
jgi:8-oxo-dGTP diphosphatase